MFDAHLADTEQALFVAETDGAVAGLVRVQAFERPEIADLPALTPRLMTEAHRWARDRGLTEIQLTVYDFNQPALRLYTKLGYAPDSHRLSRKLESQSTFPESD